MNKDFNNLVRRYSLHDEIENRHDILLEMRQNLTTRNKGIDSYTIQYANPNKMYYISQCTYEELREIGSDMDHHMM